MRDPVSQGLDALASGLRPFVADRVGRLPAQADLELSDAQSLLVFMWDHWNDLFRSDLTYVERSLVSELREFRNRWAHQQPFSENDVYRLLDDAERLLTAIGSEQVCSLRDLRRNSLRRLYENECTDQIKTDRRNPRWPAALCFVCAAAIDFALLYYFPNAATLLMTVIVALLFVRVGYILTRREAVPRTGPRECAGCDKIIYTPTCPYCAVNQPEHPPDSTPNQAPSGRNAGSQTLSIRSQSTLRNIGSRTRRDSLPSRE